MIQEDEEENDAVEAEASPGFKIRPVVMREPSRILSQDNDYSDQFEAQDEEAEDEEAKKLDDSLEFDSDDVYD